MPFKQINGARLYYEEPENVTQAIEVFLAQNL